MTRDEEIRQDLARQWRELDGERTEQDVGMIAQDIRDFLVIAKAFGKKRQSLKQGSSRPPPAKH